jgi:hypothetical protein
MQVKVDKNNTQKGHECFLLHKNKLHFIIKGMMTALLLSVSNV